VGARERHLGPRRALLRAPLTDRASKDTAGFASRYGPLSRSSIRALDAELRPDPFQTEPPACYRASWQLPGPDFHRQATTSLRPEINYTVHLQSAWRTKAEVRLDREPRQDRTNSDPRPSAARRAERAHVLRDFAQGWGGRVMRLRSISALRWSSPARRLTRSQSGPRSTVRAPEMPVPMWPVRRPSSPCRRVSVVLAGGSAARPPMSRRAAV
jgi:hypothetical protein